MRRIQVLERTQLFPSVLFLGLSLLACDEETPQQSVPTPPEQISPAVSASASAIPPPAPSPPEANPYDVPERSQSEVDAGLRAACREGQASSLPLLIEFSAPWCGDCRKLAEMKRAPELRAKLEEIPYFPINIGRFDRHEGVLEDFGIRAIANWQLVATDDCTGEPGTWTRLAARTLEPKTGKKKVSAGDLVDWLDVHFEARD